MIFRGRNLTRHPGKARGQGLGSRSGSQSCQKRAAVRRTPPVRRRAPVRKSAPVSCDESATARSRDESRRHHALERAERTAHTGRTSRSCRAGRVSICTKMSGVPSRRSGSETRAAVEPFDLGRSRPEVGVTLTWVRGGSNLRDGWRSIRPSRECGRPDSLGGCTH